MKKRKLILSILLLAINFSTKGQSTTSWNDFLDQETSTTNFEQKTSDLLKSSKFLNIEQAAKQLKNTEGKKIKIEKVKLRRKKLQAPQLLRLIRPSFVSVANAYDCGKCNRTHLNTASGYVISEDGLIVTNHHVVRAFIESKNVKNIAMSIHLHNGEVYLVEEIMSSFKDADLAIVKIDTKGKKLIPLALGETAKVGEDIFILSNPAPMTNYFSTGKVARNYLNPISNAIKLPQTEVTADYAAGSSGAPIVDQYGNLVSTVSATKSIYYNMDTQKNLQMVVKKTKPVVLLKELIDY